jgi:hypothetical protein
MSFYLATQYSEMIALELAMQLSGFKEISV